MGAGVGLGLAREKEVIPRITAAGTRGQGCGALN